jgi:Cu/Ag efflux pump CusA
MTTAKVPMYVHSASRLPSPPCLSGRLRPILVTSFAALFSLIPTAMKLGIGARAYARLVPSIIGGLMVSVAVTVCLVPAAYLWFHRQEETHAPEMPA